MTNELLTFPIPGGTATFTSTDDLSVRASREIARAYRRINKDLIVAAEHDDDDKDAEPAAADARDPFDDIPEGTSEADLDTAWAFGDTVIFHRVESWTIDRQLPASLEAVQDMPGPIYKALQDAVAELQKIEGADQFGPDGVVDKDSPTGA